MCTCWAIAWKTASVLAGDKLVLHLYWQASRPVEQDLMALIQLLDSKGQFLMYADGSPTAGRDTTDRWAPGVPLASQHLLAVPETGQPGEYRLLISLHDFGDPAWMAVVGADGSPLGDHIILPEVVGSSPRSGLLAEWLRYPRRGKQRGD